MADTSKQELSITLNQPADDNEVVLSFRDFFQKLRYYFVAWFLVSVIVGCLILGISMFFSSTSSVPVEAMVNFSFDGIERGKNPDGSDFDPNDLKNPQIIQEALNELEMDEGLTESIRAGLFIQGITPDDVMERLSAYAKVFEKTTNGHMQAAQAVLDTAWVSTQYQITFKYKTAGVTRSDAVQLLNSILSHYRDFFFKRFGYNEALGSAMTVLESDDYDYAELVDQYTDTLNAMQRYVNELSSDDTTRFRSTETGCSFADLRDAIKAVKNRDLELISSYIKVNNVTKDKDRAKAYYEYRIEALERQKTIDEETLETVNQAILDYEKDEIIIFGAGTDSTNTTSHLASDQYDKLFGKKISAQTSLSETTQTIEYYNQRLTALRKTNVGSADKREQVEADLEKLDEKVVKLRDLVEQTAEDYYQNVSLSKAYNILAPASADVAETVKSGLKRAIMPAFGVEFLILCAYLTASFVLALMASSRKAEAAPAPAAPAEEPAADAEKAEE